MKTTLLLMAAVSLNTALFSQTQKRQDFSVEALLLQPAKTNTLISLRDSSHFFYGWNNTSNTYTYTSRNVYNYDSGNREDYDAYYEKNAANTSWKNTALWKDYSYDSADNLLSKTEEIWTGTAWQDYQKQGYAYSSSGKQLSNWNESWFAGAWHITFKATYTYSGNDATLILLQNDYGSGLQNDYRILPTYNAGKLVSSRMDVWNSGTWKKSSMDTNYTYAGTDLLSHESHIWNATALAYTPSRKYSTIYNGTHNALSRNSYIWSNVASAWINDSKSAYTYDSYGNVLTGETHTWDTISGSWKNQSKFFNYYRTGYVGIHEGSAAQQAITVYPNPATDRIAISAATEQTAELWSTEGKLILAKPVKKGMNTIHLADLAPGIYILRLDGSTHKLIRE